MSAGDLVELYRDVKGLELGFDETETHNRNDICFFNTIFGVSKRCDLFKGDEDSTTIAIIGKRKPNPYFPEYSFNTYFRVPQLVLDLGFDFLMIFYVCSIFVLGCHPVLPWFRLSSRFYCGSVCYRFIFSCLFVFGAIF